MCKGAHLTHKRSGAQAQEKKLKSPNSKKENKGIKRIQRKWPRRNKSN